MCPASSSERRKLGIRDQVSCRSGDFRYSVTWARWMNFSGTKRRSPFQVHRLRRRACGMTGTTGLHEGTADGRDRPEIPRQGRHGGLEGLKPGCDVVGAGTGRGPMEHLGMVAVAWRALGSGSATQPNGVSPRSDSYEGRRVGGQIRDWGIDFGAVTFATPMNEKQVAPSVCGSGGGGVVAWMEIGLRCPRLGGDGGWGVWCGPASRGGASLRNPGCGSGGGGTHWCPS